MDFQCHPFKVNQKVASKVMLSLVSRTRGSCRGFSLVSNDTNVSVEQHSSWSEPGEFLSTSKNCILAQNFIIFTKEPRICLSYIYLFGEKIRTLSEIYLKLRFWFIIYDIYSDYDLCYSCLSPVRFRNLMNLIW